MSSNAPVVLSTERCFPSVLMMACLSSFRSLRFYLCRNSANLVHSWIHPLKRVTACCVEGVVLLCWDIFFGKFKTIEELVWDPGQNLEVLRCLVSALIGICYQAHKLQKIDGQWRIRWMPDGLAHWFQHTFWSCLVLQETRGIPLSCHLDFILINYSLSLRSLALYQSTLAVNLCALLRWIVWFITPFEGRVFDSSLTASVSHIPLSQHFIASISHISHKGNVLHHLILFLAR